jgi:hypothetical protein
MIHEIYADGTIEWFCHNEDCAFHTVPLSANVAHATVRYEGFDPVTNTLLPCTDGLLHPLLAMGGADISTAAQNGVPGSVIVLPRCLCGSRLSLKADYTRQDLLKGNALVAVPGVAGRILKMRHMHNLLLHHLLYDLGKTPAPPILPLPPKTMLADLAHSHANLSMTLCIWFTHVLIGRDLIAIPGFSHEYFQYQAEKLITNTAGLPK